jgi:glycine hydroxymethyltransferase
MVASSSIADPSALVCEAMPTMNVTAEGYPRLASTPAAATSTRSSSWPSTAPRPTFGACYANVQPMSATSANEIVMFAVLEPHDTLDGLELDFGGHLTHGSKASISGQVFQSVGYGLTRDERIDYEQAERSRRSTARS